MVAVAAFGIPLPVLPAGGIAFLGGLAAAVLVLSLSAGGTSGPTRLILAGSAVAMALAGVTTLLFVRVRRTRVWITLVSVLLSAAAVTVAGPVGIDNPEPTSILDQLDHCGVTSGVRRVDVRPASADRAWWISPSFQTHPVASIDDTVFGVDADVRPPFLGSR